MLTSSPASPLCPAAADDSGEERVYTRRSREPGELPPQPQPQPQLQPQPAPSESDSHPGMPLKHDLPPTDCEEYSGDVGELRTQAEASVASSEAHNAAHWPSNEPDSIPVLMWKSYSASEREAAGVCSQKASGKCGGDLKGKLVISLSGSPRSLLNISPGSLKVKASVHDQKSQTNSPDSCLGSAHVGDGIVSSDKIPETTKEAAVSENSLMWKRRTTVPQGSEGSNQPSDQHSIGDAAISELAKKFRLRVKRVRLPAKPNLLQKRDDEFEVNQLAQEKSFVEGPSGEPAVSKDVDSKAETTIKIDASDEHGPSERTKSAEHPGTSCSEGIGRPEDGGTPAASLFVHTEVESRLPPSPKKCTIARSSNEEDLPDTCDLSRRAIDAKSEVPATSPGINMENACTSEAHSTLILNSASQRLSNDEVNGNETLCRSMALASTSCVFTDGAGSEKGHSIVQTISSEDASRGTTAKKPEECSTRGRHSAKDVRICSSQSAPLMAGPASTTPDTSMLEIKEQTVLETLLPDEPPGYSSAEVSESSRSQEFLSEDESSQSEESENDDGEFSQSEESENEETEDSESQDSEGADTHNLCKRLSPGTPGRGGYFTEQVPSVLCDAEGNVWHVGKRAEKARGNEDCQALSPPDLPPSNNIPREKPTPVQDSHCDDVQECAGKSPPEPESAPPRNLIQLNWKWPSDADYTINSLADVNNRFVVVKERSIFVGCIPDGVENLEEVLESLMEKFLDRFDFAPALLSQIQVVKVLKDFAFVELATDKVAQIVLAANQLDVFEWGVNGYHFNIEGCNGTHTSVRPLIEHMPLKPARVIFIGNIPKSHWEGDYLETFFSRILQGSDGCMDLKLVVSVHLLPESCDAYVELASELMADALIYKCTKNPKLLQEIGEDVFICRDVSSAPLMSRHSSTICPQRSLFVGVSFKGEDFKIDCVRKVLEEIILIIARKSDQRGYIEYISVQPGTDYAYFQFNSEAFADAVMDEYIENTQLFVCNNSPIAYIILRSPQYVRPGARYYSGFNRRGHFGRSRSGYDHPQTNEAQWRQALRTDLNKERLSHMSNQGPLRPRSICSDEPVNLAVTPRKFGDEPGKRPDCVMSMGICPLPLASWNGLSSAGDCSTNPESMVIVEGLPKGLSYKLLRGALNELFERTLSSSGLLEVGMLLLRYLDRDENFNIVACLPNARVVYALVSMRKVFIVAGNEIRLLPKDPRRFFHWRAYPAEVPSGQGDLSCVSDEEATQGRRSFRNAVGEWNAPRFFRERKRMHSEAGSQYQLRYDTVGRAPATRRKDLDLFTPEWCQSEGLRSVSPPLRQEFRGNLKVTIQQRNWAKMQHRNWNSPHRQDNVSPDTLAEESHWQGNKLRGKMPQRGTGFLRFENRNIKQVKEGGMKLRKKHLKDVVLRAPQDGIRKVQSGGIPPFIPERGKLAGKGIGPKLSNRKRMRVEIGPDGPCRKVELVQERFRKHHRFEGTAGPRFL